MYYGILICYQNYTIPKLGMVDELMYLKGLSTHMSRGVVII